MTVHLVKLAVGCESVAALKERQRGYRSAMSSGKGLATLRHHTRNTPRRADEVLDGGSIYWIIKGHIRVRQKIRKIERLTDEDGRPRCALLLDPKLVATEAQPRKAMQGWRYLEAADAPPDAKQGAAKDDDIPIEMAAELKELGLL